ncbi:MAG: hypothetical protein AB1894_01280 [Chloroflexota bacterium]
MDTKPTLSVKAFLPFALFLTLLGLGGLWAILTNTSPSGGSRWAFFFTSALAVTGIALPATAFLNLRFPSDPPPTATVIVRQAIWAGVYFPTLAWLRIGRVLNLALVVLLAVGFILIEWLLRWRERSQWKPETRRREPRKMESDERSE